MARVTILLGKGGTGRTTVGRALALNRAQRGSTTLLHSQPSTQVPDERVRNLSVRLLDPEQIFEDQLTSLLPLGPFSGMITDHPAYESFLEIAPAIKEAAVLNYLYGFLDWRDDQVVLDGPATGHGLHFLEAPRKLEQVTTGKVAKRLRNVDEMLRDPDRTQIVLVALPEELPARETTQLADQLEEQGFPVSGLVVNRMPPPVPFDTGEAEAKPQPTVDGETSRSGGPAVGSIPADQALALLGAEREEAERWLDELEQLDVPRRVVPSLPGRSDLPGEVATFLDGFPEEGSS